VFLQRQVIQSPVLKTAVAVERSVSFNHEHQMKGICARHEQTYSIEESMSENQNISEPQNQFMSSIQRQPIMDVLQYMIYSE